MFRAHCACGKRIKLQEAHLGKVTLCPECGASLRPVAGAPPTEGETLEYRLTILQGPERVGEVFLLGGDRPIQLGKLADKQIVLKGEKVSRNHAQLVRMGTDWRVEDQRSTNGLGVNRKRVQTATLKPGDRIQVGEYELEFQAAGAPVMTAAPAAEAIGAASTVAAPT